jgi:hypothetical protein
MKEADHVSCIDRRVVLSGLAAALSAPLLSHLCVGADGCTHVGVLERRARETGNPRLRACYD